MHTKMLSRAHIQRTFSCVLTLTRWQAGSQAGGHTPSHYLCGEQFSSYWCERRGAVFSSSAAAAAAAVAAGRVQRREQSSPEITHTSFCNWRQASSLFFFFFSLFLSPLSLSWCDAVWLTFPHPPPLLLSSQRVPVGQPWRTPSPAAMPPSPRCLDARDSSCKPVSSHNYTSRLLAKSLASCMSCMSALLISTLSISSRSHPHCYCRFDLTDAKRRSKAYSIVAEIFLRCCCNKTWSF